MIDHNLISTKTPAQIAMMREAGKICAQILQDLTPHVKPGVTSQQINDIAYDLIVNKCGADVDREDLSGYDASEYACISIAHNEIAFYGEPSVIPLKTGDLFGVDVSVKKEGWCGDTQRMWIVGQETSAKARLLFEVGYGLAPGTRWEDVPEDWVCPDCGTPKDMFEMVMIGYAHGQPAA